jgi:NAD+ diphosphatase
MPLSPYTHVFAGNPLDRAGDRRADAAWLAGLKADPAARALAFWNGKPLLADGRIAWLPVGFAEGLASPDRTLFLGLDGESGVFAVDIEGEADPGEGVLEGRGAFADLRAVISTLTMEDAAILAAARSLFEWRRRHRYCSVCGQPSDLAEGGWKRVCPSCRAEHFPRTDPVAIMLPWHGDRCLLGRQASWVDGMFSALAGFIEPGESVEEACARELSEEAGLRTRNVVYHSSQPWPFPSSLMIGLTAEVEDDEGQPDQTELSEVRWFTRPEARALLAGEIPGLKCPGPHAIAHHLLRTWAET